MVLMQGLQLGELVGGEDGGELGLRILVDGLHLLVLLLFVEGSIVVQVVQLLLLGGEDGFDLCDLVI